MARIQQDIPDEIDKQLKYLAIDAQTSKKVIVIKALEMYLENMKEKDNV